MAESKQSVFKNHRGILIVLVLTLIVFVPSLFNDFVNWDDEVYIHSNEMVHGFSLDHVRQAFKTTEYNGAYHPLVHVSWSIDYSIGKMDPLAYHIHNLLLHLISCVLVYLFIGRLFQRRSIGLITALLFAIHPLHVEPVVWISARKELLYTLYFLAGLYTYLRYLEKPEQRNFMYATMGLFLLACFSKGVAITFPVVLVLIDLFRRRTFSRYVWLEKLPFVAVSLVFAFLAFSGQQDTGAMKSFENQDFISSMFYAGYGFFMYLIKSILPFEISHFYPYPLDGLSFVHYLFTILGLALVVWVFVKRKTLPHLFFGVFFFAVTIAPVLQFFSFGVTLMGDRFTYVPYIGLFAIYAWLAMKVWDGSRYRNSLLGASGTLIVLIYALLSFDHSMVWKNGYDLWTDAIEKYPEQYEPFAHRANYLNAVGRVEEAKHDYDRSIANNAGFSFALNNRGLIYMDRGQLDSAYLDFSQAINTDGYDKAYLNRALVLARQGQYDAALKDIDVAARSMEGDELFHYNRGSIYFNIGKDSLALIDLNKAQQLGIENSRLYRMLGLIYQGLGISDLSDKNLTRCLELDPKDPLCLHAKAIHLLRAGNYDASLDYINRAIRLDTSSPLLLTDRGLILLNKGDFESAIHDFNVALDMDSTLFQAHYNKALALKMSGADKKEIIKEFKAAYELNRMHHEIYLEIGLIHVEMGKMTDARYDLINYLKSTGEAPHPLATELKSKLGWRE